MQFADRLPISLSRFGAHDSKRALPIPGSTGSHHVFIAPANTLLLAVLPFGSATICLDRCRCRSAIRLTAHENRPDDPRRLVSECNRDEACGTSCQQRIDPLGACGVLAPGVSHDRGCADDEEGAQISVAHLRDRAETMAVAVMKPTPGIVSSLLLASVARCQARSSTSMALTCA